MLVLTRRPNQSIMIGDDIVLTVLEVKGDQIRLGIDAPRHVQVFREEVLVALQEANRSAVLEPGAAPAMPTTPGRPGPGGGRALPPTGTAPAPSGSASASNTPRPRAVPQPPAARPVSQSTARPVSQSSARPVSQPTLRPTGPRSAA